MKKFYFVILALLVAYLFVTNNYSNTAPTEQRAVEQAHPELKSKADNNINAAGFFQKKLNEVLMSAVRTPNGEKVLDKILEQNNNSFLHNDDAESKKVVIAVKASAYKEEEFSSNGARCGQTLKLKYYVTDPQGLEVFASKNQPAEIEIELGKRQASKELEEFLVGNLDGMSSKFTLGYLSQQEYQFLKLTSRPKEDNILNYEVVAVTPQMPQTKDKMRIYDLVTSSPKDAIKCGQSGIIRYKITDLSGNIIYNGKNELEKIVIGSSEYPFGLWKAMENMTVGGERSVIMPPEFLTNIYGKPTNFFKVKLPTKQMLIFDVELIEKHE